MIPADLRTEIDMTTFAIRAALACGKIDLAHTMVSRKTGLRIVAGEIDVVLKPVRWDARVVPISGRAA